jgi:hypothetical protein
MRRSTWLSYAVLVAFAWSPSLSSSEQDSGRIADEFQAGVLGFAWGADLEAVARNFPAGTGWPAVSSGKIPRVERFYAVPDDLPVLGVKRDKQNTLFGFDRYSRLVEAIFAMPYESTSTLQSRASGLFGKPRGVGVFGLQRHTVWGPDHGLEFSIIEIPHATRPSLFARVRWLGETTR